MAHCKSCHAAKMRQYRREGKFRWKYDEKSKARCYLNVSLKRGKVKKLPCEVCGDSKSQAHHDDYSKPLEVRWLCRLHHSEFHNQRDCLERWAGPIPGCPVLESHSSRDCRHCHAARMRLARQAGKFPYVYTEAEKARKKAAYDLKRKGSVPGPADEPDHAVHEDQPDRQAEAPKYQGGEYASL